MSNDIHNPYVEEIDPDQRFLIGKKSCYVIIALFLITILAPPIYRNVREAFKGEGGWVPVTGFFKYNPDDKSTPTIAHHLKAVETKIDEADFRDPPRRLVQTALTRFLGDGNQKTYIGRDGWLFLRTGIKGLTGYGPLKPEPSSPMKDPTQVGWSPPLPVIERFAAQLKERDIDLLIVPVPVKPMIYPEMIDGVDHSNPLRHRDSDALYDHFRAAGIDVLDLSDSLWTQKRNGGQPFLKQDTHWTSETMKKFARLVADHVKTKPYFSEIAGGISFEEKALTRTHIGDLVEQLDLAESGLFQSETQGLTLVIDPTTAEPVADDALSPITLLGDSFVNIFDDPSIGFANPDWKPQSETDTEPLIGAGFRRHLAKELGTRLDVVAQNGGGSSTVRATFADKPDNVVRAKKLVIWTLASRDLFLSETPARAAGVTWTDVTFSTKIVDLDAAPAGGFIATAVLKEKGFFEDPKSVTYKDCLYSCLYEITSIEDGSYSDTDVLVFQWAFKNKKMLPESRFEVGKSYRLFLAPWDKQTSLQTIQIAPSKNDTIDSRFDLTRFYVEKAEPR